MPPSPLTATDVVAYLSKSSLPTVLVEGREDILIYRWIEEELGTLAANVFPVGGRDTLLEVFDRRHEFAGKKVVFVADQDMWVFSSPPPQYTGIIWTDGYSIENDLYGDSIIESLLSKAERLNHRAVLGTLCTWFAFELDEHNQGRAAHTATHSIAVVPRGSSQICPRFAQGRGYRPPTPSSAGLVAGQYRRLLRGKLLFETLVRFLSDSNRNPKHSHWGLCEVAYKIGRNGSRLSTLMSTIQSQLT